MEIIGFIVMIIGMAGMDTEGNMWYLAAILMFAGMAMIYAAIRKERRHHKCRNSHNIRKKQNKQP